MSEPIPISTTNYRRVALPPDNCIEERSGSDDGLFRINNLESTSRRDLETPERRYVIYYGNKES